MFLFTITLEAGIQIFDDFVINEHRLNHQIVIKF